MNKVNYPALRGLTDKTGEPTEAHRTTKCPVNKLTAGKEEAAGGENKAKTCEWGELGIRERGWAESATGRGRAREAGA